MEEHTAQVRIVIADDSALLREGVVRVLVDRGFDVVAQAHDGQDLLAKVESHHPDVVVTDIRMPPTGTDEGLRAANTLADRHPAVGVLVLSEFVVPEYATRLLQQGVPGRGYLLKQTVAEFDALADAVRRVAAGENVLDPAIVQEILRRQRTDDPVGRLSEREQEVLAMMAEGRSNHAIASDLVVSQRTVESHVRNVFHKLELPDTPDDHRRVLAVMAYLRR